jgi:hypothetical protein
MEIWSAKVQIFDKMWTARGYKSEFLTPKFRTQSSFVDVVDKSGCQVCKSGQTSRKVDIFIGSIYARIFGKIGRKFGKMCAHTKNSERDQILSVLHQFTARKLKLTLVHT